MLRVFMHSTDQNLGTAWCHTDFFLSSFSTLTEVVQPKHMCSTNKMYWSS